MDMHRNGHKLATGVTMRMEDTRIYLWDRRPATDTSVYFWAEDEGRCRADVVAWFRGDAS